MRVLLAEDDVALADELAHLLRAGGFAVDVATNGVDAWHLGDTERYDAALVDVGLPAEDGLTILERWRSSGRQLPVLILTARASWADKSAGFDAGADDYLTKPFLPEEVLARLRALIRRSKGHATARIDCGPLTFDVQSGAFELDGKALTLTAFEWRLLSTLMMRKGAVVSRDELAEATYEAGAEVDYRSMEVIIGRVRRKIGAELVRTVRNHGYQLTAAPG